MRATSLVSKILLKKLFGDGEMINEFLQAAKDVFPDTPTHTHTHYL
jgi:hypothetical protein